jgi:hypothetical protein
MVDDHFRHDAPLEPIDRRSRTNLPSPYGRGAGVRVTWETGRVRVTRVTAELCRLSVISAKLSRAVFFVAQIGLSMLRRDASQMFHHGRYLVRPYPEARQRVWAERAADRHIGSVAAARD